MYLIHSLLEYFLCWKHLQKVIIRSSACLLDNTSIKYKSKAYVSYFALYEITSRIQEHPNIPMNSTMERHSVM